MKLRTRLLLAFLVVALVPLSAFAALVYARTLTTLRHVEADQIGNLATGVKIVLDSSLDDQRKFVEDYAIWDGMYYAVKQHKTSWLATNATEWVPSSSETKLVHVFASNGTTVAHGGHEAPDGLWEMDEVQLALASGETQVDLEAFNGRLYVLAASPVRLYSGEAAPAGILVFARPVTDDLLAHISRFMGADGNLAVYTNGRPSASTRSSTAWSATAVDLAVHAEGDDFIEGDFTSKLTALLDRDGDKVSVLKVSVPRATFADAFDEISTISILAFVCAAAFVLVIGFLLTGTIIRPLHRLANAAGAMATGELRQHLDVMRRDELGALAEAFNVMSEQVAERVDILSQKSQSLALEISALGDFGATLAQTPDPGAELARCASMIREMLDSDGVAVYLAGGERLELGAFSGAESLSAATPAMAKLAERARTSQRSVAAIDASAEATPGGTPEGSGHTSLIAAPLMQRSGPAGTLVIAYGATRAPEAEDLPLVEGLASQIGIALQNAEAYEKLDRMYLETVTALAAAMEAKDQYTASHADSLATFAVAVGDRMGMSEAEQRILQYAAVLHDIGKIGIPGSILNKPDRLTPEEFDIMAQHTIIGERIISRIDYLVPIARIIRSAHERWDGRGYPDGLVGEAIPTAARILLVCDAFDAMTTDRPYRRALPVEDALVELRINAGTQFDPRVVEEFLAAHPFTADEKRSAAARPVYSGSRD